MATVIFAGPGADDWVGSAPVATDTAKFSASSGSMTEDFAALNAVDLGAIEFDIDYVGRVGDENSGWAVECNGEVTNQSRSPMIHLTGGDTENVERVVHVPAAPQAQMVLSNGTFDEVVVGANGRLTVRGDVTTDSVDAVGNGYAQILAGSGSYGQATANGRSQIDVYENPATGSLDVGKGSIIRVMHDDATVSANIFGGTLQPRGGEVAGLFGLSGVLDLSKLTADLTLSGSTITVGPDLHVIPPPAGRSLTITGTVKYQGGVPTGYWPANYG